LLPLIGVMLVVLDHNLDHSRDQLTETQLTIADVVSQGLTSTLDENQRALQEIAEDPAVQSMIATQAQDPLDQVRRARPSLTGVFLLDLEKNVVTIAGGIDPNPMMPQLNDAVDKVLNVGEPAVSNRLVVPDGDIEVIALVVPVLPDPGQTIEGKPIGAVGAFLNVMRLQQLFLTSASGSGDTTIAIVAENGQVIVDRGNPEVTAATLTTDLIRGPIAHAAAGQWGRETYRDAEGEERLAVVAPIVHPSVTWTVVVTSTAPLAYAPNQSTLRSGLIGLGLAIALTLGLAMLFGELTARPLRQLTARAKSISQGDLSQPVDPVGRGEVASLSSAIHDMADRLTTQIRDTESAREEVAHQAERLRDLLRRTVRLQEDERRRIASDIHDAVSPLITGALYQARALTLTKANGNGGDHPPHEHRQGDGHDEEREGALRTVSDLLERAMAELHDVIFALRPPDLDDLGVVAAIDRYVKQVDRSGLPCELEVIGEPQRLSPEARLGLYRIVQEALHNALRHAHADEARVKMEWLADRVRVTVRDNGSGFDPEQAASPTSLGLLSMRERAAAIGGTLEITSRPGMGTAVIVERPLVYDLVPESTPIEPEEPADVGALNGNEPQPTQPVELPGVRSA
jgi:signal transduction histidine kinase